MRTLKEKPMQIYIDRRQDDVLEVLSKKIGEDSAMDIIGLGSSGKSDISAKHDKYLAGYTTPHKKK